MKKALMILGFCILQITVSGQQSARDILKQKTEKNLQEILSSSASLTGLMAIDLTSGETIGINSDLTFAQASAIKIPILMEVFKQAHEKKFALSDLRPVLPANTVGGSGILYAMPDPLSLSIRNLCVLMIGLSDNTATNTLIELVGMKNVSGTMQTLGFPKTRLQRRMIDQPASLRNEENISSPAEAAGILKLLHEGKFIDRNTSDEILAILGKNPVENSKLARGLPANVKIAFKPGGMGGVSTEWGIVYLPGRPYAIAVMENYITAATAPDIIESVSKTLFQYFSMLKATKYGVIIDSSN